MILKPQMEISNSLLILTTFTGLLALVRLTSVPFSPLHQILQPCNLPSPSRILVSRACK